MRNYLFILITVIAACGAEPQRLDRSAASIEAEDVPAPFDPSQPYEPDIEVDELSRRITNPFIRDTVFLDGEMVEDTFDWYTQDDDGNVWYMGEDTTEFEDGEPVCHCGAWESGVDGALPGVAMLGEPHVGDTYRQEYAAGIAEDYAVIVGLNRTIRVPAGRFRGCIKTHDLSALDASIDEYKYYCPGVGLVRVDEGNTRVVLVEYSGL